MAAPVDPVVLVEQTEALAGDLPGRVDSVRQTLAPDGEGSGWPDVRRVLLTGDGDSFHAGLAAEAAFAAFAGVDATAVPAQRLLDHRLPRLHPEQAARTLVVGSSASGGTERVAQCLAEAAHRGAATLAITGGPDGPVGRAAGRVLAVPQARQQRSPGILTYQATLVGLFGTALRLGAARGVLGPGDEAALTQELRGLGPLLAGTVESLRPRVGEIAERIARAPFAAVLGTGPSEGTARYAAAKLVEGAGILAYGQDLEEWWHVERFARPTDTPLLVLGPSGASCARAFRLAREAADLGRDVALLADRETLRGTGGTLGNSLLVPVHGPVREEFSPLLYSAFAALTASAVARTLGRSPFLGDLPALTQPSTTRDR